MEDTVSLPSVDDVSYAATETSSEFSGGEDFNAEFHLHSRYTDGRGERRVALSQGSKAWRHAMVNLRGQLRPPVPDEHLDCRDQRMELAKLLELFSELEGDEDLRSMDLSGNMLGVIHPLGCPPPRPPDGEVVCDRKMTAMAFNEDPGENEWSLSLVVVGMNVMVRVLLKK